MVRHRDNIPNDDDTRDFDPDSDRKVDNNPANRDPISGKPGAHPVGVGLGTAGAGAAAGALGGAIAGPVGAAVGAVVGGVAGGLAGKAAAEAVNPTLEDEYWRENYISRPYVERHESYESLRPAYRYGWENYSKCCNRYSSFDEAEPELARNWEKARGSSSLNWDRAKSAARDAWNRVERAIPGDSDRDGN